MNFGFEENLETIFKFGPETMILGSPICGKMKKNNEEEGNGFGVYRGNDEQCFSHRYQTKFKN